ncbi:MAG: hypothetical protein HY813_01375 [Candidatus Portnoybacteria bacterium]|nr:hypothetical protein [Candidatus Portnoybacteria bacterium]
MLEIIDLNFKEATTKDVVATIKRIKEPAKKTKAMILGRFPMPNLTK